MQHLGWYLNPYEDVETVQKTFAVLLGKNTRHGYAPDYAARLKSCLSKLTNTIYRITVVTHNETTSNGTRASVFGFQVGRNQAAEVERILRTNKETHYNGMYLKFKSEKQDRKQHDISMINIQKLPSVYSGVPILGITADGAELIRQAIITASFVRNSKLPLDLEATHLSGHIGKHMVITPVDQLNTMRTFLTDLIVSHHAQLASATFPEGPRLQEARQTSSSASDSVSVLSYDPFGDLSNCETNTDTHYTANPQSFPYLHDQAINQLPTPGP